MKIAIKNFLTTLRRYKVASVLNIAGMTLAFLAFYVIMSQVYYNITYNRPIKDSDRTYILVTRFAEADWMALASRMDAEKCPFIVARCGVFRGHSQAGYGIRVRVGEKLGV